MYIQFMSKARRKTTEEMKNCHCRWALPPHPPIYSLLHTLTSPHPPAPGAVPLSAYSYPVSRPAVEPVPFRVSIALPM